MKKGIPKTRIVYQANLNFKFAQPFFDFLLSGGYIVRDLSSVEGVTLYQLTERGERLLRLLQEVENELGSFFPRLDRPRPE